MEGYIILKDYFSDRENGSVPRNQQTVTPVAWAGLVAVIQGLVRVGAFARGFPERCPDGSAICGTNEEGLGANIRAHIPGLEWPLQTTCTTSAPGTFYSWEQDFAPETLRVLDLLEYLYSQVAKPRIRDYHSYFQHEHIMFEPLGIEEGRAEFRESVNMIFARQGIAFDLQWDGKIIRLLPPVLGEDLLHTTFKTGDRVLDNALDECRLKFHSPDPLVRREALERIWDCWERLKSLADPSNKSLSVKQLLDHASDEPEFRNLLEAEARVLNEIGNSYLIRHFEVKQTAVVDPSHVDYLFHRMFAMIQLLLRALPPQ